MLLTDRTGHLISTTGLYELLSFAKIIGLKEEWIQIRKGRIHFDLTTQDMKDKAEKYGAVLVKSTILMEKAWWYNGSNCRNY